MPSWLDGSGRGPVVSLENVLLNLETRATMPHTPAFFTPYSLPFPYNRNARCPQWVAYLNSILDEDTVALLQEWAGYVISGRTDLQKMMFLVGPTRSGKGTYADIVTRLLGKTNVVGPTMGGFIERFGLQSFLGMPLAIFDDVRIPARSDTITTAVERLLSIIGMGRLDVDRKNRAPWSGVLPTRIMMMSNEVTEFPDPSGALPYRTLVAVYSESFAGREDPQLADKLAVDMPGILNWALDGLDRLNRNGGRFTSPASSTEAKQEIEDAANPVRPFVREACLLGPEHSVSVDTLYAAWAIRHGGYKDDETQRKRFGKLLKQAHPGIRRERSMVNGERAYRYVGIGLIQVSGGWGTNH
jgi:putative DNA primase/helicase